MIKQIGSTSYTKGPTARASVAPAASPSDADCAAAIQSDLSKGKKKGYNSVDDARTPRSGVPSYLTPSCDAAMQGPDGSLTGGKEEAAAGGSPAMPRRSPAAPVPWYPPAPLRLVSIAEPDDDLNGPLCTWKAEGEGNNDAVGDVTVCAPSGTKIF